MKKALIKKTLSLVLIFVLVFGIFTTFGMTANAASTFTLTSPTDRSDYYTSQDLVICSTGGEITKLTLKLLDGAPGSTTTSEENGTVIINYTGNLGTSIIMNKTTYPELKNLVVGKWLKIYCSSSSTGTNSTKYVYIKGTTAPQSTTETINQIRYVARYTVLITNITNKASYGPALNVGDEVFVTWKYTDSNAPWGQCTYAGKTYYVDCSALSVQKPITKASEVVKIARGEVGYTEGLNNWNKYALEMGYAQNQPWCATFVSWVMMKANIPTNVVNRSPVAYTVGNIAPKLTDKYQARSGDIIYFTWSHVGIVDRVENGTLYVIDGNYSNKVNLRSCPWDDVKEIRRPNY